MRLQSVNRQRRKITLMSPTNYNRIAFALSALLLASPLLAMDSSSAADAATT